MKSTFRLAACLLLTAVLLPGCATLWEREIYERSAHLAQEDGGIQAALTVNSHDSLRTTIIDVIRRGESEADIRVTDYPGGLTSFTISTLLHEIQTREPIGAYAVDFIALAEFTHVLSQYTITLNIVYKDESRPVIPEVRGGRELEAAVHEALLEYSTLLTVEMPYYYAQEHDPEAMVRSFYYNNPAWAVEYPGITVNLYPSSGDSLRRIVELELVWQTPNDELRQKARDTENGAEALLEGRPEFLSDSAEENTAQTVLWLYDALCGAVEYDADAAINAAATGEKQGIDPYTAYGALVGGIAVGEGHAMAFKLLCSKLGISCYVVPGRWNGNEHSWNLVRIGNTWYHLAAALDNRGPVPTYDFFLLDDETAEAERFEWSKTLYPAAVPGVWAREGILALAADNEE
ncbi:MAG: hypothetical protein LBI19_07800 [Oscillospiraceae bacterium]|jgi:hypothetical protein|nr:hypothetical protein [Oscillospiraceae bacterium]